MTIKLYKKGASNAHDNQIIYTVGYITPVVATKPKCLVVSNDSGQLGHKITYR